MNPELFSRIKRALLEEKGSTSVDALIANEISQYSEEHATLVSATEAKALEREAKKWLGHGFLEDLLANESIEEIAINGLNENVYAYDKEDGWKRENGAFSTLEEAMDAINKLALSSGKRITHSKPRLDTVLANGERMHAAISPVAQRGISVTIRKFKRTPWTMEQLLQSKSIEREAAALAWALAARNFSLVIAGSAGSGKTSFLNALLELLPAQERVISIEDSPEIVLTNSHRVALIANEELGVSLHALVHDSMRMRPDRVVVGEVRSATESRAFFDSLLSGQAKANYCTFHATSGTAAVARFAALGANESELNEIGGIIVLKRESFFEKGWKERRVVSEIFSPKEGTLYSKEKGILSKNVSAKELHERTRMIDAPREKRERIAQEEWRE